MDNKSPRSAVRPIVLIGMTGCGKTTVGSALSELLDCSLIDIDRLIVDGEARPIAEIFSADGEAVFRNIETEYLKIALAMPIPLVIAPGGGIILRAENRALLRRFAHTVWLMRDREDVVSSLRVMERPPIYGDPANYDRIYAARRKLYASVANMAINNGNSSECAKMIFEEMKKAKRLV